MKKKSTTNVRIDPWTMLNRDGDGYFEDEIIDLSYADYRTTQLKNFPVGSKCKKYGVHYYHNCKPAEHYLSDSPGERGNDPYTGERIPSGEFLIERISTRCVRVTQLD